MIRLRAFERSDFARLLACVPSAAFLLQWSGPMFAWPLDEPQLEEYRRSAEGPDAGQRIFTAIDAATGEAVGHVELARIDRRNRSATLSRVLVGDPERRGRGLGREIVEAALRVAFDELHLHRVDLVVFDFNVGAIACYERAGFVREGTLREARHFEEGYWTLCLMAILEEEWRARADGRREAADGLHIRDAAETDLPAIVEIYNAAIPGRQATADTEPVSVESRRAWFAAHAPERRPVWVAELGGKVVGWLSLQSFYGRPAYDRTAEVSIYVAPGFRGRRIGGRLLAGAVERAPSLGLRTLLGFVFAHNAGSLRLFQRAGFTRWGHLPRVADLDGIERDLLILGRRV